MPVLEPELEVRGTALSLRSASQIAADAFGIHWLPQNQPTNLLSVGCATKLVLAAASYVSVLDAETFRLYNRAGLRV